MRYLLPPHIQCTHKILRHLFPSKSAKIVLLQEEKFKSYYGDLHYLLKEYDRIMTRILPQTSDLLRPHGNDLEYKLRPGMVTLTWTSMNIDAYKHHFQNGLQKLEGKNNNGSIHSCVFIVV